MTVRQPIDHPLVRLPLLRWACLVLGLALAALGLSLGVVQVATAGPGARAGDPPPPKTIVSITGDAADGFHVEHYDGTWLYPETTTEAIAECDGYDTVVRRVRCRTGVRRWYRDLAATQAALAYAHQEVGA